MLSVRAIYEGNNIHFFEDLDIEKNKAQFVIITFVDSIDADITKFNIKKSVKTDELDISNQEIQEMMVKSKSFEFLNSDEEDIYTDEDLKIKY